MGTHRAHVRSCGVWLQYMIQGSANINQRSMDGSRDTELAVGAYQPKFSANNSSTPTARGQVIRFFHSKLAFPVLVSPQAGCKVSLPMSNN